MTRCVVFEDPPPDIKACVASGATVIAVCTSHECSKIENCGAHYLVDNMEQIQITAEGECADTRLRSPRSSPSCRRTSSTCTSRSPSSNRRRNPLRRRRASGC